MTLKIFYEENFIEIDELDNDKIMITSYKETDKEDRHIIIGKNEAKQIISFLQNHFNL